MKKFKLLIGCAGLALAMACGHSSGNAPDIAISTDQKQKAEGYNNSQNNWTTDTTRNPVPQQPPKNTDWDKKIIKTATINLEVKNYKAFYALARDNVKKYGGYVAQEQQSQTDYKIEDVLSIKVPVDQFDNLVTEITAGEEKIIEKKISSEDVTSELIDTKSRIEARKQIRLKYLDFLKQAKNMEEALNVQHEINSIQEDIEAASGRSEYLLHAAAYSTINLTYFQIINAAAKDPDKIAFGTKVWASFKNGWNWIGDVVVGLISVWPLFLIAFICWVIYRKWIASKTRKPVS